MYEAQDHECFGDELELHFVELPKLSSLSAEARDEEPALVRWSTFFMAKTDEEVEAACKGDEAMEKAKNHLELLSAKPDVQQLARQREMAWATYQIEVGAAREEGEARGEARGRAEEKRDILRKLLSLKFGKLPESTDSHIEESSLDRVDHMLGLILNASSVEEVLDDKS